MGKGKKVRCIVCVILFVAVCSALPEGPPLANYPDVCQHMFPVGHGVDVQNTTAPFRIVLNPNKRSYKAWDEFEVTIQADPMYKFKGVFVQGRHTNCYADDKDTPVGIFELHMGESNLKLLQCSGVLHGAVSQKAANNGLTSVSFKYFAPASSNVGDIYIRATVVLDRKTFWTDVFSPILRAPGSLQSGKYCPVRKSQNSPPPSAASTIQSLSFLFLLTIVVSTR